MWDKRLSQWVRNVINPIKVILSSKSIEFETLRPYRLERRMFLDISRVSWRKKKMPKSMYLIRAPNLYKHKKYYFVRNKQLQ